MKSTVQRLAVAGALCLGLAATAAVAQDQPAAPGDAQASPGPRAHAPRGADRATLFARMRQRREQRLHDLLQIKPDQDGAFHAFLTALEQARPQHGPEGMGEGRGPGARDPASAPLSTPERLDRMNQEMTRRMAERQQRLRETTAAVKTFYAVLSPEQRKAFDALPIVRVGGRHFGGGRMWGGRMMHGPEEGPPPPTR